MLSWNDGQFDSVLTAMTFDLNCQINFFLFISLLTLSDLAYYEAITYTIIEARCMILSIVKSLL
jgi:hypothetical protein